MKHFYYFLLLSILLSSCATWIAPPYTSVDKMLRVEKGMTPEKVDETLGIKPYNMLHRDDSTALFEYHYRLKDREVNNITDLPEFIHLEESQRFGDAWYTNPSKFYVLYYNDKFSTLITQTGIENSEFLLLKNNNLIFVSKSDLLQIDLKQDVSYIHKIDNSNRSNKSNKINLFDGYTPKRIKHYILYSSYIPDGVIGLKYAVGGKLGGYISGGYNLVDKEFTYISGGLFYKTLPWMNIYIGSGVGTGYYYYYYYYNSDIEIQSILIEAGTLLSVKRFTFELGLGYNINISNYSYRGLYGKFGFGINF